MHTLRTEPSSAPALPLPFPGLLGAVGTSGCFPAALLFLSLYGVMSFIALSERMSPALPWVTKALVGGCLDGETHEHGTMFGLSACKRDGGDSVCARCVVCY